MGKPTPEGARDFLVPDAPAARPLLRAAAEPADLQAAARHLRLRALLPDRPLLPGRGSPRRPAAGADPARRRDGLPRPGVPVRADRADRRADLARAAAASSCETPFPRLTWEEADLRYGSDKPDLRFGLEIEDATEVTRGSGFKVFAERGGGALPARAAASSRAASSRSSRRSRSSGARKGLAYLVYGADGEVRSPIAKFLGEAELAALPLRARHDTLLFAADEPAMVSRVLGALRLHLGRELELIDDDALAVPLGDRLPDVRVGPGARALGRRAPSVHAAERGGRGAARHRPGRREGDRLRPRRQRRSSSPAARSGSTSPSCRRRSSAC